MIERHDSIVVQKIARLLIPFIQLFAVYVYFHGHYSPGGGFQAGILFGASIILEILVGSRKDLKRFSVRREFITATFGLAVFAVLGGTALMWQGEFLNYGVIDFLGNHTASRRYLGILIAEGGVAILVAMTLVVIFHVLAFLPDERSEQA